jgi:tetratricopeptide (TPR) repeat protein
VATQVDPDSSVELFDSYADLDLVRNTTGRYVLLQYLRDKGLDSEADQRMVGNAVKMRHEVLSRQGEQLLVDRKYGQARAMLRRVIKIAPSWSNAWANLGLSYMHQGRHDSALICLQIADGLNPFSAETYSNLAVAYLNLGDSERGEEYCRRCLEIEPDHYIASGNLMKICYNSGRLDEYRQLLYKLCEAPEATAEFLRMAGDERLRERNAAEAIRLYRLALNRGLDTAYVRQLEKQIPGLRILPDAEL